MPPPSSSRTAPPQAGNSSTRPRQRRTSSLGGDPRGDTGANAIATSQQSQSQQARANMKSPHGGKRRRAKSLFRRWVRLSLKHTWLTPLVLAVILLSAYGASPGEHNPLHSAIFLSYADPPPNERTDTLPPHIGNVTQYGKGKKDFAFVAFYIIIFSFAREFLMQLLIRPIAIRCGIRAKGKQARFMEQFYTAIYFAVFGPLGLYVMSRTPVWYFNTAGMYEGFPHRAHEGLFKAYYLLQAAYWAQQGIVILLQLEAPRKDFKELVLHHIVTLALIGLSYRFHFTYMGIAVYVTHDISDFFLATSKLLNYLNSRFTGPYFVMFIGFWAYLRHYINLRILASLLPNGEFRTVGPYELNWETQQYKCLLAQVITFPLLAILQAVNLFWFFLILRILYRLLATGEEKDDRSEDEDEEETEPLDPPMANGDSSKPTVMLNGATINSTGVETRAAAARKR